MSIGSTSSAGNNWQRSQNTNAAITTRMNMICQGYYSTSTTIYLTGYQSSGSSLSVTEAILMAVRIA